MKKLLLLTAIVLLSATMLKAQITITDDDLQGGQTYTWTSDNEYLLDGLVYLESGSTLNIEPGTVIRAKEVPSDNNDNTSSLIIARGAKIMAEGTESDPIIFTAESDNLQGNLLPEDCGQWGGLILLGKAPAYADGETEIAIEGIPSGDTRGLYGGNEPADNSGSLMYVSIRHSGVGIAPGSEIQGLTLGGVGSGTNINFVEVYSSCDDGIEIFGGRVDIRHFAVSFATDDSYDFDQGWRGTGQYLFALQLQGTGEGYDKAGEWDGANPDDAALYSMPELSNMTLIGPGQGATGAQNAIVMRDAWGGTLYNSLLVDFPGVGIEVEDLQSGIDAYGRLDSNIVIGNNTWSKFGNAATTDDLVKVTGGNPTEPNANSLKTHLSENANLVVADNILTGIGRLPGSNSLDPRPASDYENAGTVPAGLDQTSYRGAFDPAGNNWLEGWTALSAYNYLAGPTGTSNHEDLGFSVRPPAPNPASHTANLDVVLSVPANVSIEMTDLTGKIIYRHDLGQRMAGTHSCPLDVSRLNSGTYFVTTKVDSRQITRKLTVH